MELNRKNVMESTSHRVFILATLAACMLLSACGGGSGNGTTANRAPVIESISTSPMPAGTMLEVTEGEAATLIVNATDPDGDSLTITWSQISGAATDFSDENGGEISFTVPQVASGEDPDGVLRFEVTVADGKGGEAVEVADISIRDVWNYPDCEQVTGTRHLAFSRDGGETFVYPEKELPANATFSNGLIKLPDPGHLLLATGDRISSELKISADYGCSWVDFGQARIGIPQIATSGGKVVYVWGYFENTIFRVDTEAADPADRVVARDISFHEEPGLQALAVDPGNNLRILVQDRLSAFHLSLDGGETWEQVGVSPNPESFPYDASIQWDDFNHIVIGDRNNGAWISYDMGANWTQSVFVSDTYNGSRINVFKPVITHKDSDVVWALGRNLDEAADSAYTRGNHLYRSEDAGLTFRPVIGTEPENERFITNGTYFEIPPSNSKNLVFTYFGCEVPDETDVFNPGRTYLYFHDDASGEITVHTHKALEGAGSIFIGPNDDQLIYVGMDSSDRC